MSCDLCRGEGLVRVPCPDKREGCCVAHYGRCPNGCEVPAPRGDFMTYRIVDQCYLADSGCSAAARTIPWNAATASGEDKLAPVAGLPKEKP